MTVILCFSNFANMSKGAERKIKNLIIYLRSLFLFFPFLLYFLYLYFLYIFIYFFQVDVNIFGRYCTFVAQI